MQGHGNERAHLPHRTPGPDRRQACRRRPQRRAPFPPPAAPPLLLSHQKPALEAPLSGGFGGSGLLVRVAADAVRLLVLLVTRQRRPAPRALGQRGCAVQPRSAGWAKELGHRWLVSRRPVCENRMLSRAPLYEKNQRRDFAAALPSRELLLRVDLGASVASNSIVTSSPRCSPS
jgi:hypothetical protein